MKKKYFKYSQNSESDKYTEITESEYYRLKASGQHFFICLDGCFLECEPEEYHDYFVKMNHTYNALRDRNGNRVKPVSYDALSDTGYLESMMISDPTVPTLEQSVEERIDAELEIAELHTALEKLRPHEKELIYRRFWECADEKTITAEQHISQQAVNKKIHRILCRLLNLMLHKK